jgi:hypothetical protein
MQIPKEGILPFRYAINHRMSLPHSCLWQKVADIRLQCLIFYKIDRKFLKEEKKITFFFLCLFYIFDSYKYTSTI